MKKMMMTVCMICLTGILFSANAAVISVSFLAGKNSDGWIGSKIVNCLLVGKSCTWTVGYPFLTYSDIDNAKQPSILAEGRPTNMDVPELSTFTISENHSFPLQMTGTKRFVNLPIQEAPRLANGNFQFKLEISDRPLYPNQ